MPILVALMWSASAPVWLSAGRAAAVAPFRSPAREGAASYAAMVEAGLDLDVRVLDARAEWSVVLPAIPQGRR